jgi:hypothetical protein
MIEELIRRLTKLERDFEGLIKPEVGGWKDWTPTVTQGVAVAVTVTEAKYKVKEDDVRIYARLAVTGAGTAGQTIVLAGWAAALNPNPGPAGWPMGVAIIIDATGPTNYSAVCRYSSNNLIFASQTANNFLGANPAFTLANGDAIYANMYWKI